MIIISVLIIELIVIAIFVSYVLLDYREIKRYVKIKIKKIKKKRK